MQGALSYQKTIVWVILYSVGMAFLESAVVIYLREIYYPYGFDFPLVPIDPHIAITEIGREAATLLMLLAVGIIAGRSRIQRFAYFLLSFAVWDIFYYIFLKALIGWPESWMTMDVLFLIPTTWVGPVIAPLIISLSMILLFSVIIYHEHRGRKVKFSALTWILLILGSMDLILAFIWDYSSYMLQYHTLNQLLSFSDTGAILDTAYAYIPRSFNWFLFVLGLIIIITGIITGGRNIRNEGS
jgi:hypothetical protein